MRLVISSHSDSQCSAGKKRKGPTPKKGGLQDADLGVRNKMRATVAKRGALSMIIIIISI